MLPSCLPAVFSTSTVSLPESVAVPFTEIGLRHCVSESGVLTTIGDLTGPVVVAVLVADCFEEEQAVTKRTNSAAKARRATAPSPAAKLRGTSR